MGEQKTDPIQPEDKDWTWVLERACPDCGFDAGAVGIDELADLVTRYTEFCLRSCDATTRRNGLSRRPGHLWNTAVTSEMCAE